MDKVLDFKFFKMNVHIDKEDVSIKFKNSLKEYKEEKEKIVRQRKIEKEQEHKEWENLRQTIRGFPINNYGYPKPPTPPQNIDEYFGRMHNLYTKKEKVDITKEEIFDIYIGFNYDEFKYRLFFKLRNAEAETFTEADFLELYKADVETLDKVFYDMLLKEFSGDDVFVCAETNKNIRICFNSEIARLKEEHVLNFSEWECTDGTEEKWDH